MNITLSQHDVVLSTNLDFVAIVWAKQHTIAGFGCTHVLPHGHYFGPHQPFGHLSGCWNHDAAVRTPLIFALGYAHQQTIIEHLDWKFFGRSSHARQGTSALGVPHVAQAAERY